MSYATKQAMRYIPVAASDLVARFCQKHNCTVHVDFVAEGTKIALRRGDRMATTIIEPCETLTQEMLDRLEETL
jgi:hypothetical protein